MHTLIKKFAFIFAGVAALFFAHAVPAHAFVQFNNDPQDRSTFRVSNVTNCTGCSTTWASAATAKAGDTVAFIVYYHNTGNETASNVRIRVTPQIQSNGTVYTFTGSVLSDNGSAVSGTTTVSLSGVLPMTYIPNSVMWYKDQSATGTPYSDAGLFTTGIPIGNITAGWPSQGYVRVSYQVGQGTVISASVNTDFSDNVTQTSAMLHGTVVAGAPLTQTYFKYAQGTYTDGSFLTQTLNLNPASNNGPFSGTLSTLSPNTTYSFQACGKNQYGSSCGGILTFTTAGSTQTYQCNDGIDNDLDGLKDYPADPGCYGPTDPDESNSTQTYQCNDWYDNDGDGYTDYPNDPGCNSYTDNDEYNNTNSGNRPDVTTLSPDNVDQDSALFQGEADPRGDTIFDRWFEWGTLSSNLSNKLSVSGSQSTFDDFSRTRTGLNDDTRYYYRACAQNSFGIDCGSIVNFRTDQENNNDNNNNDNNNQTDIRVVTLAATNVTNSDARLNGLIANNADDNMVGWFEWGKTSQTTFRTPNINLGSGSSESYWSTVSSLSPGTLYYFRAVAEDGKGLQYFGDIQTFKTGGVIPPSKTYVAPTVIYTSSGTGSGNSLMMLTIDSRYETVYIGDMIDYTVTYKNISGHTLSNAVLRVEFPSEVEYLNGSAGSYSASDNAVTIPLGTVVPLQTATYTFQGFILPRATENQLLVTTASLVFTDWRGAQQEATAYELNTVRLERSHYSFSFWGMGFLPNTLFGWLLLLLIIFLIVYIARQAFKDKKKES